MPEVIVGASDLTQVRRSQIYQVSAAYAHPGYTGGDAPLHDIALLRLSRSTGSTVVAQLPPLELPPPVVEGRISDAAIARARRLYGSVAVAGFGRQRSEAPFAMTALRGFTVIAGNIELLSARLSIKNCRQIYPRFQPGPQVCFGDDAAIDRRELRDACQGDSGGPLTLDAFGRAYIVGIVSYGIGCEAPYASGVYTTTSHYRDWIGRITSTGAATSSPKATTGGRGCRNREFTAFFDWDSSSLGPGASETIDYEVARTIGCDLRSIQIVGKTDTSHDEAYALALTERMAATVRRELLFRGVPADAVTIEGRGENDLPRPTADNVREPLNRRVDVTMTFN